MRSKLIIFVFLLAAVIRLPAQEYSFRHLTTAEGLLSDLRMVMTEDRQGRLWIGSDEGINVFDGYQISSYSLPDNSGLASNNVQRIYCDKSGTIWIWTTHGIQYKKEKDSRFRNLDSGIDSILVEAPLFAETSDGLMAIAVGNDFFFIDNSFKTIRSAELSAILKQHGNITCIEHFRGDEWFMGFTDKLVQVDLKKQKKIREIPFTQTWTVSRITDTTIMVGSFVKDTVLIINIETGHSEPINNWLSSDGIRMGGYSPSILPVAPGKYVVACRYDGIYIVDLTKRTLQHLMHDPADPASIKSRFVRRIFITRDGTMFVHARSLSYTSLKPPRFKSVKSIVNETGEKYDGGFFSFVKDDKNNYWISSGGHLARWDRETDISHFYPYYTPEGGPQKFKTVRAVVKDKLDRIWVGTFGGGLGLLLPDGSYEQYKYNAADPDHSIPSTLVIAITMAPEQNFFICTNGGFALFDPIARKVQTFSKHPKLKKIARRLTNGIIADKDNNWWIGQTEGLYYYDRRMDSLFNIPLPANEKDKLINAFCTDRLGNVYVGGWGGLYIIPAGTKTITKHLDKSNGLASDNVMSLVCDQEGKIWVIGNIGVARYDPVMGQLQTFDARDGLEQSNHPLCSGYVAPDGEVFISSSEGFNYFFPAAIKNEESQNPLKVFVTGLELKDSLISLPELDNIAFRHYQNNLSFTFQAVDFKLAPILQYRYKLGGFDTAYTYAGMQRTARYTNLPAGKYFFIVEASTNGKDWNVSQQKLSFRIRKALWQSLWFRVLVISLLAAAVYIYYKNRIRQINKEARMRSDYEIKLNELENSALRTQMNPHFIFNSLNTINSFINSNERAQANQYISKFSKLVRLILDHSRQKKISLKDELEVAEVYMQLEQIRFEGRFQFTIKVHDVDAHVTEVPPLIIQPFVENAILHGLLPLESEGLLKVEIMKKDKLLQCIIEDNGIGREAARKIKEKSGFQRRSHGMEITLKRIELFNKENGVLDPVRIIDLKEEGGNQTGTRVEIKLAYLESF